MSIQKGFNLRFLVVVFGMLSTGVYAQKGTVNVYQDDKIVSLMKLKNDLTKENKVNEGFTIQLYSGGEKTAIDTIEEYNNLYSEWAATIVYATPNYKVWVGNFFTRLEADRIALKIKENFPGAFVLKPDRRN